MTEITRIALKRRRHIRMSRELDGAIDELLPNYQKVSPWVEEVLWAALLEEYGEEAVLEAVEEAKDQIEEKHLLNAEKQYELPA